MADQIAHSDLTALSARRAGYGLSLLIEKITEDADGHGALIALAAKFLDICDEMDLDPEAAFFQVTEAIERGDALVYEEEAEDISVFLGDGGVMH